MNRILLLACLLLLAVSADTHAQLIIPGNTTATFLGTVPENPIAGQPYLVRATFGPCEAISIDPNDAVILNSVGNAFTIQVPGVFVPNCSIMVRETTYLMPPIAQPGTYTVALQMIDAGDVGRLGTRLVTVVAPGTVQGGVSAVTIPASSPVAWIGLGLCLVAFAPFARRS
jgi:hypothetical protein